MSRFAKILTLAAAALSVALVTAACGTEKILVPKSAGDVYRGAVLFNQRCAGCHTLAYAATYGSAPNIRTATDVSGPNFNQRCERPIDRVLYAIENGGFSGAYMPQNVVVGQDAIDVAKFVATYAGREAPRQTGVPSCQQEAIGTLPSGSGTIAAGSQPVATTAQAATTATRTATRVAAVVVHTRGRKRSAKT
ncbi:MAG: c-type cytochrome [Solirubrobacteraceae bacterium]